jgi:tripartite-type tricarboxylate transporter receptor subunit TctC
MEAKRGEKSMKTIFPVIIVASLSAFSGGAAIAQDAVAEFYKGKQVKLISAYAAGGNSALYGDVVRRHLGKHIPGNPVVILQNMPGAAGLVATNYMAQRAARDGTEIALTSRTAPFEPVNGNERALFDSRTLNWLGSANVETSVCIANTDSGVASFEDVLKRELVVGGSAPDALDTIAPNVSNQLLSTRFRIVGGYPLSSDILLAMERREVSGFCGVSWPSLKLRYTKLMESKLFNVLFQIALEKAPDLPNVPLIQDFAKDSSDKQVMELLIAPQGMGRPFFTAPDVPADRLAALRKAFAATMADPEFLAEAAKAGIEIQYVSGEKVAEILQRAYATPKPVVERMKKILGK